MSIIYSKGSQVETSKYVLYSLKIVSIEANSTGPDVMPPDAAFHLGLHCLPKYPFRSSSIQMVKGVQLHKKCKTHPESSSNLEASAHWGT